MLADKRYLLYWKEDNLTSCLIDSIELTRVLHNSQISVNPQALIISEEITYQGADFLSAPKVDFKFSSWHGTRETHYYAEAKNLSEFDWQKPDGALVRASEQRGRYIDTGIENFLTERYPQGCLVGYIVNGQVASIVSGINRLLVLRGAGPRIGAIDNTPNAVMATHYQSTNQLAHGKMKLDHLLLQLA
ncbi:hypothetical protein [Hymenobacter sp. IS2118]|uniref:hypothetical protein n=1 Tax=Hymenobacter sp. IS2118 TaxID=1505605 RepID=UPI001267FF9F|nr:hypothetical protein [Hymenobacter sp. IS2118]